MKRILTAILLFTLLTGFPGCGHASDKRCEFYYLRTPETYDYGTEQAVVAREQRTLTAPSKDMEYLLRLYLDGPVSEDLRTPFPEGTRLVNFQQNGHTLTIRLSEEYALLENMELTLAAACLSKTCFSLTDTENLIVLSGSHVYTYSQGSFLYLDDTALPTE